MSPGFGLEAAALWGRGEKKLHGKGMYNVTVAAAQLEDGVSHNDFNFPPAAEEDVHSHLQAGLENRNIP